MFGLVGFADWNAGVCELRNSVESGWAVDVWGMGTRARKRRRPQTTDVGIAAVSRPQIASGKDDASADPIASSLKSFRRELWVAQTSADKGHRSA